jgi:hypothetical protein
MTQADIHSTNRELPISRRGLVTGAAAAGFLQLVGCATSSPVSTDDPNLSLVAGYIDMADAPSKLEWVSLKDHSSAKPQFYGAAVVEGVFFHVGIRAGSYQVDSFGGQGGIPLLTSRPFEYSWGARGRNETAVRIAEPGCYFLGSYAYVPERSGFFEPGKFSMHRRSQPSQRDVFQRVMMAIEARDDLRAYKFQVARLRRALEGLTA